MNPFSRTRLLYCATTDDRYAGAPFAAAADLVQHGAMSLANPSTIDRHSRNAALALAFALPTDVVLYLLLPMYADHFGVTLAEAGMLLAANRLIRIAGNGIVARLYARYGDRAACSLAVTAAAFCSIGYATLTGFWALLPLRLLWGLSFSALNLSTQVLATADANGASLRSGKSRAWIASGPVIALPLAGLVAGFHDPKTIFWLLAATALAGLLFSRRLPTRQHAINPHKRILGWPNSLDLWSFLEGFALDGLFILGLSYLGRDLLPGGAVMLAGVLLAMRYLGEIVLSPVGGLLAERHGAARLLLVLSVATALALTGFGAGWLWSCAAAIVVLRALQLPLLTPLVAQRTPGPERVHALAARNVWRDIGAGTGPMLAGILLPLVSPLWIYAVPAALLVWAALACVRHDRPAPVQD